MTEAAGPRTTTHGFLFADLRDYSRFVEATGDVAAARLLTTYRRLVRDVVTRHEGAEIRTEGDTFYVVFPSASSAVRCGVEIVDAATGAQDGPIRVGVGVHAGETAETEEGFVGSAVNIAARVCAQAAPGELLVTETVRSLTRTLVPYRFVSRGSRRLKGITEPIELYSVLPPGAVTTGKGIGARRRLGPARVSQPILVVVVAVLVLAGIPLAIIASGNRPAMSPPPAGGAAGSSNACGGDEVCSPTTLPGPAVA
jgi:class 3 adenylate cyclase